MHRNRWPQAVGKEHIPTDLEGVALTPKDVAFSQGNPLPRKKTSQKNALIFGSLLLILNFCEKFRNEKFRNKKIRPWILAIVALLNVLRHGAHIIFAQKQEK